MSHVPERPTGAKPIDPPASVPRPLALGDLPALRAWLASLREHVLDVLAAAEDAARRPSERMFSRHEVRRRLANEERVLLGMVDAAERGLPAAPAQPRP